MLLTYIYIHIYIYIYIDIVPDTSGESKNNIGPPSGGPKKEMGGDIYTRGGAAPGVAHVRH